jgi:hypothetical protein
MKLFRIYTENKNYEKVIKPILESFYDGFTVFKGEGNWKRQTEKSLLIEIYTDNISFIKEVSSQIKTRNNQESILIIETDCKVEFV